METKMKTVIINGSPRKGGETAAMVAELRKTLKGQVLEIRTYDEEVRPCVDCRYCWKHQGCVIQDRMQDWYREIELADHLVIASPLYFSEITGSLLSFASRFQLFFSTQYIRKEPVFAGKKKKGAVLLVGGNDTSGGETAIKTCKILLKQANAPMVGAVMSLQTDRVPVVQDPNVPPAMQRLTELLQQA